MNTETVLASRGVGNGGRRTKNATSLKNVNGMVVRAVGH